MGAAGLAGWPHMITLIAVLRDKDPFTLRAARTPWSVLQDGSMPTAMPGGRAPYHCWRLRIVGCRSCPLRGWFPTSPSPLPPWSGTCPSPQPGRATAVPGALPDEPDGPPAVLVSLYARCAWHWPHLDRSPRPGCIPQPVGPPSREASPSHGPMKDG